MKILFLAGWFPFPPRNGSELRINALLRGLAAEHRVTLVAFQRGEATLVDQAAAERVVDDVHVVNWREFRPMSWRALRGWFGRRPRSVVDTYSDEMAAKVRKLVGIVDYDVAVLSELTMAPYGIELRGIPTVLEDVELAVLREQAVGPQASGIRLGRRAMWVKHRAYVRRLLRGYAACTVVSAQERALLEPLAPQGMLIESIPNCVWVEEYERSGLGGDAESIVFIGALTFGPNYDAVCWFLRDVLPVVRRALPSAELTVTGDHGGRQLPATGGVRLTGELRDVRSALAGAAVSVVPVRTGGGTRLKILEAMAVGTPVVATSKGAEGLEVEHRRHLLLADGAPDFAAAVVELLRDGKLRRHLAANARSLMEDRYDWARVMPRFRLMVERVASGKGSTWS